jgi:hypothetical protein
MARFARGNACRGGAGGSEGGVFGGLEVEGDWGEVS